MDTVKTLLRNEYKQTIRERKAAQILGDLMWLINVEGRRVLVSYEDLM